MSLTPMMKQYMGFKNQYPDKILLFRMGDFYESFGEDAQLTARILNITLTKRNKDEKAMALAGFPHKALDQYLPKIINAGYCAVIVDQIEDPKDAKGIVKRGVTRVVTPGTLDGDEANEVKNSYLASFYISKKKVGISLVDLSTGEVLTTTVTNTTNSIDNILNSYSPAEVIVIENEKVLTFPNIPVQFVGKEYGNVDYAKEVVSKFYDVNNIESLGFEKDTPDVNSLAMALEYISDTQRTNPEHLSKPKKINISGTMILDRSTIRNLELVSNSYDGATNGSLLSVLDQTMTPMGRRMLYAWILNPLINLVEIEDRLKRVEYFYKDIQLQNAVRELLKGVNDIERIVGKIGLNRVNARDLKALQLSLEKIVEMSSLMSEMSETVTGKEAKKVIKTIISLLELSISESPPVTITEGKIIKKGYNKEVDEFRSITGDSRSWIEDFVEKEKERTGITSLKVGFNNVFGYYIEITRTHQDKVPDDYVRKQTLVNSERYITEELKEKEEIILGAEGKLGELEYKLFQEIREQILPDLEILQEISRNVSEIDILSGFAYLSKQQRYSKPTLYDFGEKDGVLDIEDGRHPIVESLTDEDFISNDTLLNLNDSRMAVLTGPNMSGKSTYIRQVAIITLLAQIGCYVPAKSFKLSLVDRIFTRVGASDDLSRGRSTFMVEMDEAANIVNNATKYSLVILDEVGRGTSTYDGVSIAWALSEHLMQDIKARTLFATHYHELLKLEEKLGVGVKNYNVLVEEDIDKGVVIFLRKIVEGGTDRSYGIYVAQMAGLPKKVIKRANEILESFEQENMFVKENEIRDVHILNGKQKKEDSVQIPLFELKDDVIHKELKELDLDSLTPLEVLNIVSEWKKKV